MPRDKGKRWGRCRPHLTISIRCIYVFRDFFRKLAHGSFHNQVVGIQQAKSLRHVLEDFISMTPEQVLALYWF